MKLERMPPKPSTAKERYCWFCGDSMGLIQDRYYESTDTCGKPECEREASIAAHESDAERQRW